MNNENVCGIVRDLLPLYVDDFCSPESRELVTRHVGSCPGCAAMLAQLRDPAIEDDLNKEKNIALTHQAKKFKRRSTAVGTVIAAILMIPVIVCLIVNIAAGHALDWFFIVLASLLLFASLTVVPLLAPRCRFNLTVGAFTLSLILLLGVCALYSGGRWFPTAASACLFGLGVVLLPFVVCSDPLNDLLYGRRGLTVFIADTLLLFLMYFCIALYTKNIGFMRISASVTLTPLIYAWVMFLLIRYLPCHGLVKAGLCTILTGALLFFVEYLTGLALNSPLPLPDLFSSPGDYNYPDGPVKWLILTGGVLAGVIMITAGFIRRERSKKKK